MKKYLLTLIMVLFSSTVLSNTNLYIQSVKAKLLEEPNFKSQLVIELKRGTQVQLIEKSGRWIKVKYETSEGWLSSLLVSSNPPLEKKSVLKGQEKIIKSMARRRASSNSTAAATRGLRKSDRARASDDSHADYQALEQVDSIKIKDAEAWQFHKEIANKHHTATEKQAK